MENKRPPEVRVNGISTNFSSIGDTRPNGECSHHFDDVSYEPNDATKDINTSLSPEKKTFKSVVQRHFVKKDKLFVLVHDLLKSIDDEKQAQEDLLSSFRIAREITEPIREQAVTPAPSHRVRRRKRRDDKPLLERIQQSRRESIQPLEDIAIYNKNVAAVGELKVKADENDESKVVDNKEDQTDEQRITSAMKPPSVTERGIASHSNERVTVNNINDSVNSDTDSSTSKTRQRAKSSPASHREKISASYEMNKDENTREVDQLVLDSVVNDNDTIEVEKGECLKNSKKDTNNVEQMDKPEGDSIVKSEESECSELTVEVETDTDTESSQEEANIKVIGANDEIDDDLTDEDFDDEIDKLSDPNFHVSVMEYNRAPASLHPTLDSIAEASSESFQSMPTSSRSTSSVIEIQSKKNSLPWREVNHSNNSTFENNKVHKDNSHEVLYEADDMDRFDESHHYNTKRNSLTKAAENDNENDKYHANDNVLNDVRSDKRREEKQNIKYAEYIIDEQSDNEDIKHTDVSSSRRKHRHKQKTSNEHSKSNAHRKVDQNKKLSHENRHNTKDINGESDHREHKKSRSKSRDSSKKLISVDILGMFEDNADLQRISRSELITPKQTERKDKTTSKRSPKRSRSSSPRKKSGKGRHKHDMTPLPPGLKTCSDGRTRSINSVHRLKGSYSSRDSSSSSFDDGRDAYKSLQSMKDERRYKKPDTVLWERLEISEGNTSNKHEKVKWADRYDNKYRYAGLTEDETNDIGPRDGHRSTWNVPIYEQIKNIKGSKNVPDISKLSKTIPREERVGRLYIDLKQERRATGFSDCRPLSAPRQTRKFDEFTHL